MFPLIMKGLAYFSGLNLKKVGATLLIGVLSFYVYHEIKNVVKAVNNMQLENSSSKETIIKLTTEIERLDQEANNARAIAQSNFEAYNDIRKHQDKMIKELDRVEKAGIRLGLNLSKLKERTKNDEDGELAPVLFNTLNGLHNIKSSKTKGSDSNTSSKR